MIRWQFFFRFGNWFVKSLVGCVVRPDRIHARTRSTPTHRVWPSRTVERDIYEKRWELRSSVCRAALKLVSTLISTRAEPKRAEKSIRRVENSLNGKKTNKIRKKKNEAFEHFQYRIQNRKLEQYYYLLVTIYRVVQRIRRIAIARFGLLLCICVLLSVHNRTQK